MESFEEIGARFNTDKVIQHGYHRFYPLFLEQHRHSPILMLEIGIGAGESLHLWEAYFSQGKIYGIDKKTLFKSDRVRTFTGDQSDKTFLKAVIQDIGEKADFIVDDGSHKPEDQVDTFNYLFIHLLKEGGIYIIEDIETSYWESGICYGNHIEKGYKHPTSTIEIFKNIIDCVNDEFLKNKNEMDGLPIPLIVQREIGAISFQHNCIIITKKDKAFEKFTNREYRFKQMLNKKQSLA
jgi:hypothetical protein